ncbi:hypothetical protein COCHEDRAFT_1119076 [Bipolaris maydis C5]|uniref:Zn(2)-C6 fungal-type domain-containing protein n=1 Tax=Cochliobolus heterostrophus (strain C5 / ATCC 48332 / race O) TaxID=701091 RepID=M2SHZ6_COCH5|nr:hypothetical protein COCHEDRAFT_1121370 [Bipolaris maydis C5]EMD84887.1 hypothetical protein COCHEDRAFT_1120852 [Bipolaris maydis C5]EMD85005.1 hypothetical protein COCHEDRAFT_1120371 [Bipolaris maydis C5]EMD85460.1 hypothetical protein COCHEDRAFT_1119076 [Bipolaris maydis C5]
MPKVPSARRVRPQNSTEQRQARADRIRQQGNEMTFRCKRCEEKNLRCFVDTATGRCAGCISVKAECSLFVSEEEWEKVEADKRQKRLALLRAEAEVARLRLEVAETEALERSYADRDHAILSLQDRAKEQAEGSSAPGTGLPLVEPSLSGPSTDLGWLQADSSGSLSLDYFLSLEDPVLSSLDAACDTLVLDRFDHILVVLEFDVFC